MYRLPNELLEHILEYLAKRDLWAVLQVSTRFRNVATVPFLSRFGISQSNLQSGTLSLSDSFFLILVVAQICPIQRLVCFQQHEPGSQLRYKRLASILAITAPIPDIVIYNRQYMLQRTRRETVHLLSRIPQAATDTFLVVKGVNMYISRPRQAPAIRWKLLPPPLGGPSIHLSTSMKVLLLLFGIPLLFAYLVCAIVNCGVVLIWAYRRVSQPRWPQSERIIEDAGLLVFDDWMRIQTLPGRLTTITLTEQRSPVLTLRPLPELPKDVYSSLLPSLDLGFYLLHLRVQTKTDLTYTELIDVVQRHAYLTHLTLQPNALRASSLTTPPIPPWSESRISTLTAPAPYIPHLLPVAPAVQHIYIPFQPAPASGPAGLAPPAFDLAAHRTALAAIATLAAAPLTLTLAFRLNASALPWRVPPPDPATPLPRLHELALCAEGRARFQAAVICALVPWLARFPGLGRVSFAHGAVERIPFTQRALLAEAICAACRDVRSVQDVAFNIVDD
ncbi:hypothetical protein B0H15DRAFT_140769 [Mycena belliarum]|uniref:F-box domain-containing protein n=1 Tax=Mycena belliarum TaxID=1033014 RepID=A0AAD6TMD5_9AGAR|nr:hypothetical protein B0H15DRAFT_140769 [Mycena belliae]